MLSARRFRNRRLLGDRAAVRQRGHRVQLEGHVVGEPERLVQFDQRIQHRAFAFDAFRVRGCVVTIARLPERRARLLRISTNPAEVPRSVDILLRWQLTRK